MPALIGMESVGNLLWFERLVAGLGHELRVGDAAKIRAIYVHPSFARRGLGKAILHFVEAEAMRAGFRALEMGATVTGAPLYAREGYREMERMEIPLHNGAFLPVIRMCKPVVNS